MLRVRYMFLFFLGIAISPGWSIATATSNVSGSIIIAGNGPEGFLLEELAQAFEKIHPRVSVEVNWHPNAKPVALLKAKKADIALTVEEEAGFENALIAWDGMAVINNFSNPVKALTTTHVQEVIRGKARFWSEVDDEGPEQKIFLVHRKPTEARRAVFERKLGGFLEPRNYGKIVGSDTEAINEVAGTLSAISFLSMAPALLAQEHGISIKLLFIDGIEPQRQTVRDGSYPFRLPIFLLTQNDPSPPVGAFRSFVLSGEGQRIVERNEFSPVTPQ